jgi:SanA protein
MIFPQAALSHRPAVCPPVLAADQGGTNCERREISPGAPSKCEEGIWKGEFGTIFRMWKKLFRFLWRFIRLLIALGLLALFLPRLITAIYSRTHTYNVSTAPQERVAIIFGAGLTRDGYPTAVLRDRVETAAQLYFGGKVEKLLMSGDNRVASYNEPEAMRQYALGLGVPEAAIVLDYAGRRTYDTCYRARAIFGVDSALLVTQGFHLPRALFLCNALGLRAVGVEADNAAYRKLSLLIWNIREQFATVGAFVDVYISRPLPVLGRPEPIFSPSNSAGARFGQSGRIP